MSTSALEIAKKLIKPYEGLRLAAYRDPRTNGEPITIGYGTTRYSAGGFKKYGRQKVMLGDILTQEQAEDELDAEIERILADLLDELTVKLNDNELGALISFSYNLGDAGDDLQVQRLNQGKKQEFADKLLEYINKGSPVEAGLLKRRKAERAVFLTPVERKEVKPTWINLVRHMVKEAPEYRAYLMNKGDCIEIKRFGTRQELIKILTDAPTVGNVAIGTEGWHIAPGVAVPDKPNILTVPYYSQRDYGGAQAWSICGCTSVAMVLSYWGIKIDPNGVLKGWGKASCQSPPGCEGVFEANKLNAASTYNGTWKEIRDQIDQDRPVVVHGRMTGSGHIIVIIGYDDKGYYCNDPAGKWSQVNGDSYADNPKNGAGVYYREEAMWGACGGDGDVWYSVAWGGR